MLLLIGAAAGVAGEDEGKKILKPFVDIGPVLNTFAMVPYPTINNLVPTEIGLRSSMKSAAFLTPLRPTFVQEAIASFEKFVDEVPDAAGSLVAFEFYDATKVNELDTGSFANRGYHLNGLVMPSWKDAKNDAVCRQWARDVSNLFKAELGRQGEEIGKGVEGASRRGKKNATMLYGNYDQYDEISKDVFGDHYERLQKIKARYDPNNMFNKLFPNPDYTSADSWRSALKVNSAITADVHCLAQPVLCP
ncbi:Putative berberine/berberine, FAD-binding, type PCMH, subdomain 2 [Septoria linicola]|uniref:Berberine/berberine, FAD-binding, type PCMH, subdomain 2 n=1 Tax=Septoria linicola TaxID=215465 RepID=A0A9Q9B827_9PEZI|nr:putative berberine/berberine, FAD-binding, type PCMH, subdomain 2 [Septoria linicola]USW59022.1 Putative berberine/berberine, FAD-binding, type PCMH, subdomain 2 [Septoria linicola]